MNPAEQRARFTAVSRIELRMDDVETVVGALAQQIVTDREAFAAAIGTERTHRLQLANEQRSYVDSGDKANDRVLDAWRHLGLWGRLRWLVRGAA